MAGTALDHLDLGSGHQPQHLRCLLAHVLRAGMARDVQRRRRRDRRQAGRQPFLAGDIDDVFADVEGRVRQRPTSASSGRISGHSNFSISAQDGTRAMTS